jgi:hypothetical protein
MSTPVTALEKTQPNSLIGMSISEMEEICLWAVKSGAFKDIKSISQAGMKIMAGKELGIPPMTALNAFHFIEGKVVPSSDVLASLIKRSGKYNYKILEHSKTVCTVEFWEFFDSQWQTMGVPISYTLEDAKTEKADEKMTYKKWFDDMAFAACMRKGVRRYCADLTKGSDFTTVDDNNVLEIEAKYIEDAEDSAILEESVPFDAPPEDDGIEQSNTIVEGEIVEGEFTEVEDDDTGDGAVTTPEVEDTEESESEDESTEPVNEALLTKAMNLLELKSGGDAAKRKSILKGKDLSLMPEDILERFYKELQSL